MVANANTLNTFLMRYVIIYFSLFVSISVNAKEATSNQRDTTIAHWQIKAETGLGAVFSKGEKDLKGVPGYFVPFQLDLGYQLNDKWKFWAGVRAGSHRINGSIDNDFWKGNVRLQGYGVYAFSKGYDEKINTFSWEMGAEYLLSDKYSGIFSLSYQFPDRTGGGGGGVAYDDENGETKLEILEFQPEWRNGGALGVGIGIKRYFRVGSTNKLYLALFGNIGLQRILSAKVKYWSAADSLNHNPPPRIVYSEIPPEVYDISTNLTTVSLKIGYYFNLSKQKESKPIITGRKRMRNHLYFLLGGEGTSFSLNYEREFLSRQAGNFSTLLNYRIGLGGIPSIQKGWGEFFYLSIPTGLVVLNGYKSHYLEVSPTMSSLIYRLYPHPDYYDYKFKLIFIPFLGYRYQAPRGLLFKIGYTPMYFIYDWGFENAGFWEHWAGVGIGFSF